LEELETKQQEILPANLIIGYDLSGFRGIYFLWMWDCERFKDRFI